MMHTEAINLKIRVPGAVQSESIVNDIHVYLERNLSHASNAQPYLGGTSRVQT